MPLIEVKDFPSTIHYQEYLRRFTIPDLIDTWEGSAPLEIFINRYKLRLIESSSAMVFKDNNGEEADMRLAQYIYGLYDHRSRIGEDFNFEKFFISEIKLFIENKEVKYSDKQTTMLESYLEFLTENEKKMRRIDIIAHASDFGVEKLSKKLKSFYKSASLNLYQLDEQLEQLFYKLDISYELFEKSFKGDSEEKILQKEEFLFIDWDYLKKPFQLEDDRFDVIEFIKGLNTYFREQLYQRKLFFEWQKTPNTYLIIEYFIEELKQEMILLKNPTQAEVKSLETKVVTNEIYPRHIFASQKDYDFFCVLVKQATTVIQLSFVYRKMSEKENPLMIVVKDKQFRDWFNAEPFDLKLNEATNTYINAQNTDRTWGYDTAKSLFFSKS